MPTSPDIARVERVLRAAREATARRWIAAEPGPWGKDAPEPATASFEGRGAKDDAKDDAKDSATSPADPET